MAPSRMYAKHPYNTTHVPECGNTWYYTFQHNLYKYLVITNSDVILHQYYITR